MAVGKENVLKPGGAAVVEEGVTLADAAERGGIEFGHAFFVAEADVVGGVRRIALCRNVAVDAAAGLKQRLAAGELGFVGRIIGGWLQRRGRRQGLKKGRDVADFLGRRL